MKKPVAILLCLVLVVSLTACGSSASQASSEPAASAGSSVSEPASTVESSPASTSPAESDPFADGPEVTLIFATSWNDAIFYGSPAKEICETVNEKSNGKITLQLAWESSLGSDAEMLESTIAGDIAFVNLPCSGMTPYIPAMAMLEAPMLYDTVAEANAVMELYDEKYLASSYEKLGIVPLASCCAGFRVMTNNKYIDSMDDFKGMVIRTQENKYLMSFWSSAGANPTYIAFPELAVSLQQGVVDGQENPITGITYTKGIQKYVYDTNVTTQMDHIFANKEVWEGLPEAYRELLQEIFEEICDYRIDNLDAESEKVIASLPEEYGMEYVEISDELRAQMKACTDDCYALLRTDLGDEAVDTINDCIAEYEAAK